jgi:hypothetical protein
MDERACRATVRSCAGHCCPVMRTCGKWESCAWQAKDVLDCTVYSISTQHGANGCDNGMRQHHAACAHMKLCVCGMVAVVVATQPACARTLLQHMAPAP